MRVITPKASAAIPAPTSSAMTRSPRRRVALKAPRADAPEPSTRFGSHRTEALPLGPPSEGCIDDGRPAGRQRHPRQLEQAAVRAFGVRGTVDAVAVGTRQRIQAVQALALDIRADADRADLREQLP